MPHPGSQQLFLACPYHEALLHGERGSGKTEALLMCFAQHVGVGYGPAWRGMIFRQTYPQLTDVVAKSKRWFYQLFPRGSRYEARYNAGSHTWTWPDGEQLMLKHMRTPDDYWGVHGHEAPFIGFEELANWPTDECYTATFSINRTSVPGVPRIIRATTNPFGRGHGWLRFRFIDPALDCTPIVDEDTGLTRVAIRSSMLENLTLMEADPQYRQRIAAIADPNKRKAWLEGSWDIAAGGIFADCWDERVHPCRPFTIPPSWRIDRSFDWGSSAPFAVLWWAESDGTPAEIAPGLNRTFPRGTVFLIAEWYGWNGRPNEGVRMLAKDIARGILEREQALGIARRVRPGPADNQIFDIENGNCISDDMAMFGVHWERSDKSPGSRVQGWERLRELMVAGLQQPMEHPGIFVFQTCRQTMRTVPSLGRWDNNPDDIDPTEEDHIADAMRYRVWTKRATTTISTFAL